MIEGRCDWRNRKKRSDMCHRTGEIINWGCTISIFVQPDIVRSSELNISISAFGSCRQNGKPVEHPIALLNYKSAAVTGRQDSHLRSGVHDIRLPTWKWVSELKQVWQRLHHLSKEVSSRYCVSAELEMPKNRISGLWTCQVKVQNDYATAYYPEPRMGVID